MNTSALSLVISSIALALSVYAVMTARGGADAAQATTNSISRVQETQSVMQSEWTRTSTELSEVNSAISQMLNELYANQELMAEFMGIEVEADEGDRDAASEVSGSPAIQ